MENQKHIVDLINKRNNHKEIVHNNKINIDNQIYEKQFNTPYLPPVKSSIEINKGFSIVGKPKEIKNKSSSSDKFYLLKSEFDQLVEHNINKINFST